MDIYEARRRAVQALIDGRYGGSQASFCADVGLSSSYLSRMLKREGEQGRKRIGEDMAVRIEKHLDLEPGALLNASMRTELGRNAPGIDLDQNSPQQKRDKYPEMFPVVTNRRAIDQPDRAKIDERRLVGKVTLAVMDVRASMGRGALQPSHENVVMSMVVEEAWLRRHASFSSPDSLALVTGIGDSMFPTFEDGDPLLVDRGVTDIRLDAVYVLSLNDELYIKRVQRRPDGTVMMISDNKSYEPYHIKDGDRDKFQVLGRVVMVWNARRI